MKIIDPYIEFVNDEDLIVKLRKAYAVCYKNESQINWNRALGWILSKISIGHTSPCEHIRIQVPQKEYNQLVSRHSANSKFVPYGYASRIRTHLYAKEPRTDMNVRDWLAIGGDLDTLAQHKQSTDYCTVKIVCDRGISHEIVRHRSMSFTQESTRYCNYKNKMEFINLYTVFNCKSFKRVLASVFWVAGLWFCNLCYKIMIRLGSNPQEARAILPHSIKTEIWVTGTFDEWREFIRLRKASSAHPQMREIVRLIQQHKDCPVKMRNF